MAIVKFSMTWYCYGETEAEVPDEVIEQGEDAIREYLLDNWVDIPLPDDGAYVAGSDEIDTILDY